jgi:hypothetical protein
VTAAWRHDSAVTRRLRQPGKIGRVAHSGDAFVPGITLSHDDFGFNVEGKADALLALADAVERPMRVEVSSADGSPASLSVTLGSGPLVMSYDGNHARLVGNHASLHLLAQTLRNLAASPPSRPVQRHGHIEYFPGHTWIAAESVPVIAYLAEP